MKVFGLTELGFIISLEVDDKVIGPKKLITSASVLDIDKSSFSIEYTADTHGDVVRETITEDPREIHARLARAKAELDKRELAFMRHLFLIDADSYNLAPIKKIRKPKSTKLPTD